MVVVRFKATPPAGKVEANSVIKHKSKPQSENVPSKMSRCTPLGSLHQQQM